MTLHVALIVDNPLRDLAGLTLVASHLAAHGATCHLVPMIVQETELRALAPDLVVINYLRPTNEFVVRDLLDADVSVVVLDTEGGVFPDLDRYARTLTDDRELRRGVAALCAWGPVLARNAVERDWYSKSQVFVTGSPRFDLYASPWRDVATAGTPTPEAIVPPIILFNGNFPGANPRFQSREQEAEMLVKRFGWDRSYVQEWQSTQYQTMVDLSSLASDTGARHPDASIVYRPHPFESPRPYQTLLGQQRNVHLIQTGSVDGWILRSCAVVQRSCTTAIESALAGVPTISPRWIPAAVEVPVAEAVSIPCESPDELDAVLSGSLSGEDVTPASVRAALDDVVRDWFYAIDGNAHERVSNVVMDAARPHSDRADHLARCRAIGTRRRGLTPRVLAKRFLPPEIRRVAPDPGTRARGQSKLFREEDVATLVAAFMSAGGPEAITTRPSYATWLPFGRSVTLVRP